MTSEGNQAGDRQAWGWEAPSRVSVSLPDFPWRGGAGGGGRVGGRQPPGSGPSMPCLGQLQSGPGCCPAADRSPASGQDRLLMSHCIAKLTPEPASQGVICSFIILALQPGHLGG